MYAFIMHSEWSKLNLCFQQINKMPMQNFKKNIDRPDFWQFIFFRVILFQKLHMIWSVAGKQGVCIIGNLVWL